MIKKALFSFIFLILLVGTVSALVDIKIEVEPGFKVGETIRFDYTFTSNSGEEITYTPKISCIDYPEGILNLETISLLKDTPLTKTYEGFKVTGEDISQQCLAIIDIQKPFTQIKQKMFEIVGKKPLGFNLLVCKDVSCSDQSKIFLQNEVIYLDYTSSVDSPTISAILTYPDKSTQQISLPTSIEAEQIGTYELEVSASKEGYRAITDEEQFGAIEKKAEIESVALVDEKSFDDGNGGSFFWIWLIVGLAFLVLIIYFVIRKKINSKSL